MLIMEHAWNENEDVQMQTLNTLKIQSKIRLIQLFVYSALFLPGKQTKSFK